MPLVVKTDPTQRESEDKERRADREERRRTDDAIIFYTRGLFFATALLAIATYLLWRATKGLVADATKTGARTAEIMAGQQKAMELQVRGLHLIERAVLVPTPVTTMWHQTWDQKGVHTGEYWYSVHWGVRNVGRSATLNMKFAFHWELRDAPIPDPFDFPFPKPPRDHTLPPTSDIFFHDLRISAADLKLVGEGKKWYYIWAEVTYKDIFDAATIHTLRVCNRACEVLGDVTKPERKNNPIQVFFEVERQFYAAT